MSATFADAWPTLRAHEFSGRADGGFNDRPADLGGPTKWGLSLRYLMGLGPDGDLDHDGDVDAYDVQASTEADAMRLAERDYWRPPRLDLLASQDLATKCLDLAYNMGVVQMTKVVQAAVNREARRRVLREDGVFGPGARAAVNAADARRLLAAIRLEALTFYRWLLAKHPDQEVHRAGWELRACA